MVKVSTERLPQSQVALQIEVDEERIEKAMESAYRRLSARVKIPGFRPGKAPRNIVERHLGEGAIRHEAIDRLMPELYKEALDQEEIEPVDRAVYELVTEQPLVAKFTVPVRPRAALNDYASLRVPREEVHVEPERIQEGLEALRRRYATLEPITRPLQWEDVVRADVEASAGGRNFLKEEDAEFQLTEGRAISVPGFAETLLGHQKGDEYDAELPIPDDSSDERLRGKQAHFHVRLKETKELILPELDAEFARQVGEGFESVELLRTRVESDLRESLERDAEHRYHDHVLDALVERAELEFPPVMVEREIDRLLEDQTNAMGSAGRAADRLERYLSQIGKTEEELRSELTSLAEARIRRSLVLSEVAEAEHIDVTDTDVEAEIERLASGAGGQADELRRMLSADRAKEGMRRSLRTRKTIERLAQIASGEGPAAGADGEPEVALATTSEGAQEA